MAGPSPSEIKRRQGAPLTWDDLTDAELHSEIRKAEAHAERLHHILERRRREAAGRGEASTP